MASKKAIQPTKPELPLTRSVTVKDYELNQTRALHKKTVKCESPEILTEKASGNFVINLSTASFDLVTKAIHNALNITEHSSRNDEISQQVDKSGAIVADVIKIKSWSVVKQALQGGYSGPCKISINMYRTTNTILINSVNASDLIKVLQPSIEVLNQNSSIKQLNKEIQSYLRKVKTGKKSNHNRRAAVQNPQPDSKSGEPRPQLAEYNARRSQLHDEPDRQKSQHGDESENDSAIEETCPLCDESVTQDGVLCEVCNAWIHYKCEHLSDEEIKKLENTEQDYICNSCQLIINSPTPPRCAKQLSILRPCRTKDKAHETYKPPEKTNTMKQNQEKETKHLDEIKKTPNTPPPYQDPNQKTQEENPVINQDPKQKSQEEKPMMKMKEQTNIPSGAPPDKDPHQKTNETVYTPNITLTDQAPQQNKSMTRIKEQIHTTNTTPRNQDPTQNLKTHAERPMTKMKEQITHPM